MTSPSSPAAGCRHCGADLPARANFCPFCGNTTGKQADGPGDPTENATRAPHPSDSPAPEAFASPAQPTAMQSAGTADEAGIEEKLRLLKRLLESELITPDDYERRKAQLLDAL